MPRYYTPDQQRAYDAGYAAGLRASQAETREKLTMESIRGMTTEEVAARMDEVNEVLGGGQR